jgi:hypothetical protein
MGILYGTSGCLLIKPKAVHKLSELTIDADKPWEARGITNVKEVTAGMTKGDLAFFDGTRLAKITPGPIGTMFTTHDFGNDPTWSY